MSVSDATTAVNRRKLHEQCFLMHLLLGGVGEDDIGLKDLNETCKYTSFIPIYGAPTEMMSVITGRGDMANMLDLTPYQLSFLVPKIRLFKTYVGQSGEDAHQSWDVELLFADNISGLIEQQGVSVISSPGNRADRLQRMLESRAGRGTGVGITGFSWNYEGTNPAEAANLLTANLSIHFNDIQELFQRRGPYTASYLPVRTDENNEPVFKEDCYFQYVDLIMRTALTGTAAVQASLDEGSDWCKWANLYNPEFFELKAIVGWEFLPGAPFSDEQTASLKACSTILYLTIVDHLISYNEDGTMSLDISYRAAIEGILDDPNCDLLLTPFERTRQAQVEAMIRAVKSGQDQQQTGAQNVSGVTDQFGTPEPVTQGAADSRSQVDQLEQLLERHLDSLRAVARTVAYDTLLRWVSDDSWREAFHGVLNTEESNWLGRKLEEDTYTYESIALTEFKIQPSDMYGAPWYLSYGEEHGAKIISGNAGDEGAPPALGAFDPEDQGVPRIKKLYVNPEILVATTPTGTTEEETGPGDVSAFTTGLPPWATSSGVTAGDVAAASELGGLSDANSSWQSAGATSANSAASSAIISEATEAASTGYTGANWANLYGAAVEDLLFFDPAEHNAALQESGHTYGLDFIYYGDLLDWAIRRALWRPPYNPDGEDGEYYVTLDSFTQHAGSMGGKYSQWDNTDTPRQFPAFEAWDSDADADGIQPALFGAGGERITVQNAIDNIKSFKERKMDKINIIVGCIEFRDRRTQEIKFVNIADLPISLAKWNEWFVLSVMQPAITSMSLSLFIKKTMRALIFDVLMIPECYDFNTSNTNDRQRWDLGITNFTLPAYKDPETNEYINPAHYITQNKFRRGALDGEGGEQETTNMRFDLEAIAADLNSATNPERKTSLFNVTTENTEVYHFIAIYARGYDTSTLLGIETEAEASDMRSNPEDLPENLQEIASELKGDVERGIFHFHLGQNQGLLKSIKFNRTDTQYLAEARMQAGGAFGYNQLRGRYEATVTLQGNTFFLPGQLIYINPKSVGSGELDSEYEDTALLLGLGGYYIVTNVQSAITPEFFETTLNCVWTNYGKAEICNESSEGRAEQGGGAIFTVQDAQSFAHSIRDSAAPGADLSWMDDS